MYKLIKGLDNQHPMVQEFLTTDKPIEELAKSYGLKYENYRDRVWRYRKDFYFKIDSIESLQLITSETPSNRMLERWVKGSHNSITRIIVDTLLDKDKVQELYTVKWYTLEEIKEYYNNNDYLTDKSLQEYFKRNKILRGKDRDSEYYKAYRKKVSEKQINTNHEKYGTDFPNQNKEAYQKIKNTNIGRYGVESTLSLPTVREKIRKTNIERYGVPYPSQNKEIGKKVDKTNIERYGQKRKNMSNQYRADYIDFTPTRYVKTASQVIQLISKDSKGNIPAHAFLTKIANESGTKSLSSGDISGILGLNSKSVSIGKFPGLLNFPLYHKNEPIEQYEIFDYIKTIYKGNVTIEDRNILNGFELDLYIKEYNLGIEFNGSYWHSDKHRSKHYHEEKKKLATEKGITLYSIWEYDWLNPVKREIIKSQIAYKLGNTKNTIYARNTSIKKISSSCLDVFLNKNHIQGAVASKYRYGLFSNEGELVSVMSFSDRHFSKKAEEGSIELLRFSNKLFMNIPGGFSKLLKYAVKDISPKIVLSYANLDLSDKNPVYAKQGFSYVHDTGAGYKWISHTRNPVVISRQKVQPWKLVRFTQGDSNRVPFEGASRDFRLLNDKETEREYMERNNFFRVWDCGNSLYRLVIK